MGKKKHWSRNKDRVSLDSVIDAPNSKTTSTTEIASGSTTNASTPLLRFFYGTSASSRPSTLASDEGGKSSLIRNGQGRVLPSPPEQDSAWRPKTWLDPSHWSTRVRNCKICRAVRWIYNFCTTLPRIHWNSQWCRDLIVTLALVASCMYSLYLVLEFAASQVASAQELDGNCSIVYVTIPGPIITVSLIAASPSNPARGTYYFSVVNGTTGWLDSIAPPSRFSTLPTRTPYVTPIISSLPTAGSPPSGQNPMSSTGSSSTLVAPPSTLPTLGVTATFTSTILSGSTLVTTIITGVPTANVPVSPPPRTSSANPPQPGPLKPSAPTNEPQRPWPSPLLPSTSLMPSPGSSPIGPPPSRPSLLPSTSSSLGPIGSPVTPTLGSNPIGRPSSSSTTNVKVTPGLPSDVLTTDQRITSTTFVIIVTTIPGGMTTTFTSTSTTVLGVPSPTTPPLTTTSSPAITVSSKTLGGVTPPLTSLSKSTLDRASSSDSSSPTILSSIKATSTYSGGATSVLISISRGSTSQTPTMANPSLGKPTPSQVLTTQISPPPNGSETLATSSSMGTSLLASPTSTAKLVSSIVVTTVTSKAADGQPITTIMTAIITISQELTTQTIALSSGPLVSSLSPFPSTGSEKFTVSLPRPSTGPDTSRSQSATLEFPTSSTRLTSAFTTTIGLISSAPTGPSGSSSSLSASLTSRPSSFTVPSSASWSSLTMTSKSGTASSSELPSISSDTYSTSRPLTMSPSTSLTISSSMFVSPSRSSTPSSAASLASSLILTLSSSSETNPSIASSFSRSLSTNNPTSAPGSSSLDSASRSPSSLPPLPSPPPPPPPDSTFNVVPSFSNTTSIISTPSFMNRTSSSVFSSGSSVITSRASQTLFPTVSVSSETGFMSIQTETTATRSALSSSPISSRSLSNVPLSSSVSSSIALSTSQTPSSSSLSGRTTVPTSGPDASLSSSGSNQASTSVTFGSTGVSSVSQATTNTVSLTSALSGSMSFQARGLTTKVIAYGDTAISFVFPSPEISTTVSYWTGVYPTVTGPLPSDLQSIALTTRTERQTPLSALPSFELFTSRRRSFKTVVTTIYDDEPAEGVAKRQETPSTTGPSIVTAVVPVPAEPEPTLCGESGNFTLTFDDTWVGDDDHVQLVAKGMKNPYHHLFYANGFTYVPDKWEPFPAISQPNVAMFLPLRGQLFPNTAFAGTLLPGEIGAGPRASVKAYWFNAYSGYFGCALNGLTPCTLRISGYRYDEGVQEEVLVAEQNVTIPACWGYINCRLTQVFFGEEFRALSGIQFNAYTYNLGIPQVHMMDDLQMEWYNKTCSAGILRIGHT